MRLRFLNCCYSGSREFDGIQPDNKRFEAIPAPEQNIKPSKEIKKIHIIGEKPVGKFGLKSIETDTHVKHINFESYEAYQEKKRDEKKTSLKRFENPKMVKSIVNIQSKQRQIMAKHELCLRKAVIDTKKDSKVLQRIQTLQKKHKQNIRNETLCFAQTFSKTMSPADFLENFLQGKNKITIKEKEIFAGELPFLQWLDNCGKGLLLMAPTIPEHLITKTKDLFKVFQESPHQTQDYNTFSQEMVQQCQIAVLLFKGIAKSEDYFLKKTLDESLISNYITGRFVSNNNRFSDDYAVANMSTRNPQFLVDQMKANQGAHVSDESLAFALGIAVIYQFVLNQEIVLSNSSNPISLDQRNTFYRKIMDKNWYSMKSHFYSVVSTSSKKKGFYLELPTKQIIIPSHLGVQGNQYESEHLFPMQAYKSNQTVLTIQTQNILDGTKRKDPFLVAKIPLALTDSLKGRQVNADLFNIINQTTLRRPYPDGQLNGNHDGTHSLRQLFLLRKTGQFLMDSGQEYSNIYQSLSDEEHFAIELATVFLRAGRIDEKSFISGDDFYRRSFLLFNWYAQQMKINPTIIDWLEPIMCHSCKPIEEMKDDDQKLIRFKLNVKKDSKTRMVFYLFDLVHNLDLKRVREDTKDNNQKLFEKLFGNDQAYHLKILEALSEKLLDITGNFNGSKTQKNKHNYYSPRGLDCYYALEAVE